jgi:hypothetical protein
MITQQILAIIFVAFLLLCLTLAWRAWMTPTETEQGLQEAEAGQ